MADSTAGDAGLRIICSNRVESLAQKLAARLLAPRPVSPFAAETVVVPSPAMARWLNLRLAAAHGVAANIQYPLPANWVWALTGRLLEGIPQSDPMDRHVTAWRIHGLLPELLAATEFRDLRGYLPDPGDDVKRWQLATRIADVFDRYQFYRPDLIRGWDAQREQHWQAILWRALTEKYRDTHRVAVLDRLQRHLRHPDPMADLPQRVSLFAVSTLPPILVQVLHSLAACMPVDFYQHSPTDQYWADLLAKKAISRKRIASPKEAAYFETGNELLASWGRQGQALQDLLLDDNNLAAAHWEDYEPPPTGTVLGLVQHSIFDLQAPPAPASADDSIHIHVCHSPLRECQVLHDNLLAMLDRNHDLRPEDILVLVPEISRYAPYIEAVFRKGEAQAKPFIPWNLSDISVADEHPLVRTFLQLLELPDSRFPLTEVLSYLDIPEVIDRFDLDESACEAIRELLAQAQVRWGLDGDQKAELGLPPIVENTWQQAEQRLFAGFAFADVEFWDGIAPLSQVEGNLALVVGRFWSLLDTLRSYRHELAQPRPTGAWQVLLNRLLGDLFSHRADGDGKLQQIRDCLDGLVELAGEQTLSPALLRHWLTAELSTLTVSGRYFSGGVTFCGMRPMRSLPFPVICLLGMNEQAFPRRERRLEFDRMAERWLPGDPHVGDEDRYLLLETLLCARQRLYVSYTGRDLKGNNELQPSVLVGELTDFLDTHFSRPGIDLPTFSQRITSNHPMQPFSARNFIGANTGYDAYWCAIANAISRRSTESGSLLWPTATVAEAEDESPEIELSKLVRFIRHPVEFFFTGRLGIRLGEIEAPEDEELFSLDGLHAWKLKSMLVDHGLREIETEEKDLRALGLLPHGVFAKLTMEETRRKVKPFLAALSDFVGLSPDPKTVDIPFRDGTRLVGQIGAYFHGRGVLHHNPSSLKGKALLTLWLEHLALCASDGLADGEMSMLVCADAVRRFHPLPADAARAHLQDYLSHYRCGRQRPLPVFPQASYAWATKTTDTNKARAAASSAWHGNEYHAIPGDKDDPYIKIASRGLSGEVVDCPEFKRLALAFYTAPLAHAAAQ